MHDYSSIGWTRCPAEGARVLERSRRSVCCGCDCCCPLRRADLRARIPQAGVTCLAEAGAEDGRPCARYGGAGVGIAMAPAGLVDIACCCCGAGVGIGSANGGGEEVRGGWEGGCSGHPGPPGAAGAEIDPRIRKPPRIRPPRARCACALSCACACASGGLAPGHAHGAHRGTPRQRNHARPLPRPTHSRALQSQSARTRANLGPRSSQRPQSFPPPRRAPPTVVPPKACVGAVPIPARGAPELWPGAHPAAVSRCARCEVAPLRRRRPPPP